MSMGKRGRQRIQERFTIEYAAAEVGKIFESVVNREAHVEIDHLTA
jgi:hypothetical protein